MLLTGLSTIFLSCSWLYDGWLYYLGRVFFSFKDFFHLFMRDTEKEADTGRGRSRLLTGSLMWNSIPRSGSLPVLKADVQPLNHPGVPKNF